MSYRGPNPARIQAQGATIQQQGGYTATWRQFISATTGIPAAGLNGSAYYREQTITALLGAATPGERQTPGGILVAGELMATTREKLGRQDELIWRGISYRVESDPTPAPLTRQWMSLIKRST